MALTERELEVQNFFPVTKVRQEMLREMSTWTGCKILP